MKESRITALLVHKYAFKCERSLCQKAAPQKRAEYNKNGKTTSTAMRRKKKMLIHKGRKKRPYFAYILCVVFDIRVQSDRRWERSSQMHRMKSHLKILYSQWYFGV